MPYYQVPVVIRGTARVWTRTRREARRMLRHRRIDALAAGLVRRERRVGQAEEIPFRREVVVHLDSNVLTCDLLRSWQSGRQYSHQRWHVYVPHMALGPMDRLHHAAWQAWLYAQAREEARRMREAIGGTWRHSKSMTTQVWRQRVHGWPRYRPWLRKIARVWWFGIGSVS